MGNLSFFTSELQIQETFSRVGPIKRIIMGLNRESKTPCGSCFVEYFTHEHARECLKFINGTMCDDRVIRCELDGGFKQGRQFGRGTSGGQIRDERRSDIDLGRGGLIKKQDAPRKRREFTQRGGNDDKDLFGRDRSRPPAPVPELSGALPSARRPPSSSDTSSSAPVPVQGEEEESRRRDEEADEDNDRPRKNPRFREADDDDHDNEGEE